MGRRQKSGRRATIERRETKREGGEREEREEGREGCEQARERERERQAGPDDLPCYIRARCFVVFPAVALPSMAALFRVPVGSSGAVLYAVLL